MHMKMWTRSDVVLLSETKDKEVMACVSTHIKHIIKCNRQWLPSDGFKLGNLG